MVEEEEAEVEGEAVINRVAAAAAAANHQAILEHLPGRNINHLHSRRATNSKIPTPNV